VSLSMELFVWVCRLVFGALVGAAVYRILTSDKL
jgi:hypothetical protein